MSRDPVILYPAHLAELRHRVHEALEHSGLERRAAPGGARTIERTKAEISLRHRDDPQSEQAPVPKPPQPGSARAPQPPALSGDASTRPLRNTDDASGHALRCEPARLGRGPALAGDVPPRLSLRRSSRPWPGSANAFRASLAGRPGRASTCVRTDPCDARRTVRVHSPRAEPVQPPKGAQASHPCGVPAVEAPLKFSRSVVCAHSSASARWAGLRFAAASASCRSIWATRKLSAPRR